MDSESRELFDKYVGYGAGFPSSKIVEKQINYSVAAATFSIIIFYFTDSLYLITDFSLATGLRAFSAVAAAFFTLNILMVTVSSFLAYIYLSLDYPVSFQHTIAAGLLIGIFYRLNDSAKLLETTVDASQKTILQAYIFGAGITILASAIIFSIFIV